MCLSLCPVRVFMLILCTFILTCLHANILLWNFTKLCMVEGNEHIIPNISVNNLKLRNPRNVFLNNDSDSSVERETSADHIYNSTKIDSVALSTQVPVSPNHAEIDQLPDLNKINLSKPLVEDIFEFEDKLIAILNETNDGNSAILKIPEGSFSAKFFWSAEIRSLIFSSFAWGAVVAVLPCSYALQRFGLRKVLSLIGTVSALATLLTPFAAFQGYRYLIVCRILQGFGFAAIFPAAGALTANWARLQEHAMFLGFLLSCVQISLIISMPVSGIFCASKTLGWPSVYYFHGILTCISVILFWILFRDTPRKHFWITGFELEKIVAGKGLTTKRTARIVPWRSIATSVPVWAVFIAALGNQTTLAMSLYYIPTYLNQVLMFSLFGSGFLAAVPGIAHFFVKNFSAYVSDHAPCQSQTLRAKIFNSIGFFGIAVSLIGAAFVPDLPRLAFGLLALATAFAGINASGFYKSATLISGQFSPIVMGGIQLITCLCLIFLPFLKTAIVHNDSSAADWRILFVSVAGLIVVTGIVFCIFGSGMPQTWTREKSTDILRDDEIEPGILDMKVLNGKPLIAEQR